MKFVQLTHEKLDGKLPQFLQTLICQQTKTTTNKNTGLFQPLEVPETPTHTYSLDFIGPLPEMEDGNNFIMTVVDHLTGYCVFLPTQQDLTARAATTLLHDHVIKYSVPHNS